MSTSNPIWLVVVAGVMALLPLLVGLVTSYIKISVVLGMLKSGIGAQGVPSAIVIMALSLAMTLFIMGPVLTETATVADTLDYSAISKEPNRKNIETLLPLVEPWKVFMSKHAGNRELSTLEHLARGQKAKVEDNKKDQKIEPTNISDSADIGRNTMSILIPAFILTELKEAFAMGFVLLLPFLAVDLIVSNILVGLGMNMVSSSMVALPLKLMIFVLADGWLLLSKGLVTSYTIGMN